MFAGFDPAGSTNFGVAILLMAGNVLTVPVNHSPTTVNSVSSAIAWISNAAGGKLMAAGIDAPLTWSDSSSGWRGQDLFLRRTYSQIANRILATNSLYGAVVVQGPALGLRLKQQFPQAAITETHPKATLIAIGAPMNMINQAADNITLLANWFFNLIGITPIPLNNDNELDALVSAYVAWAGSTGQPNWQDLVQTHGGNLIYPLGHENCYYWFPQSTSNEAGR